MIIVLSRLAVSTEARICINWQNSNQASARFCRDEQTKCHKPVNSSPGKKITHSTLKSTKKMSKKKAQPKKRSTLAIGARYFLDVNELKEVDEWLKKCTSIETDIARPTNEEPYTNFMSEKATQSIACPTKPTQVNPLPSKEKGNGDIVEEEIIENNVKEIPKDKQNKKPKLGFSVGIQDKIGEPLQVNLKQICNCYAFALMKHIIFSKEKDMLNELGMEPQDIQKNDLLKICVKEQLDFPKSPTHPTQSDKLNDIFEQSFNGIAHEMPVIANEKHSAQRKNSGCDLSYSNSHVEDPNKGSDIIS